MLSSKAKRAKCSTHKQRVTIMLYNKVCDVIGNISELLDIQLMTDTTILQVRYPTAASPGVVLFIGDRITYSIKTQNLNFSPQVSSLGITPFFVENVSELQLCAIKLVTAVSMRLFSVVCGMLC